MTPVERQLFTREAYHKMGEVGVFGPKDRVELIQGEIFKMSPISSRHAGVVNYLARFFYTKLGNQVSIAIQNPIKIKDHSEPEPDIVVAKYREDDYRTAHPGPEEIFLVIEVAESSLVYDRTIKLDLYADAGIPEYWLVNLEENCVEVFRSPSESSFMEYRVLHSHDLLIWEPFQVALPITELLGMG